MADIYIQPKLKTYEMSPADNVIYFPANIDVRICPKNAMSSIKEIYRLHRNHPEYVGRVYRLNTVMEEGFQFEIPFRKNSLRMAVARDPVARFKSAIEYIAANREYHLSLSRDDLPVLPETVDGILDKLEAGKLRNNHFYTQAYYMGNMNNYDMIFSMKKLPLLFSLLHSECKLKFDPSNIHENKSTVKKYPELTTEQIDRVKTLYEKDYQYGWANIS